MTHDNRAARIAAEIVKGKEALQAGVLLLGIDLFNDAVTRIYYAAFHFATAALAAVDVQARSHRALQTLVSQHLVNTNHLPPSFARDLRRLQSLREAADYDSEFRFDRSTAEEELRVCEALIAEVERFLAASGF